MVVPQGMENSSAPLRIYLVEQLLFPAWSLCFPSYLRKKKDIRKIQENNCDWNFADLLGKINTISDSVWYIIYHSRNLKLMNSQAPSSLKCVAQFPRADSKQTEREACWKATRRACVLFQGNMKCPILTASEGENYPPASSCHILDLLEVSWKARRQHF